MPVYDRRAGVCQTPSVPMSSVSSAPMSSVAAHEVYGNQFMCDAMAASSSGQGEAESPAAVTRAPASTVDGRCIDAGATTTEAPYGNAALAAEIQGNRSPADDGIATTLGAGATGLSALGTGARLLAERAGDVPGGSVLYNAMAGAAAPLRAMQHYSSSENPAESTTGRATYAGLRTAGETATAVGLNGARLASKSAPGAAARTSMFASTPGAVAGGMLVGHEINGGVRAGLDVAHTLGAGIIGDTGAMYRGADQVEENATNGEYGFIAQGLTLATSSDARARSTDNAAASGERGRTLAWGNAAGDLWADAMGHNSGQEGYWTDADSHQRELDEMRWYKPWSW